MLNKNDVIQRLCKLQEEVGTVIDPGYSHPSDCFCGKGGFWKARADGYGGTYEKGFRNDGFILEYIEKAVREKLKLEGEG